MLACRRATASVSRFPFPPLAPDWRGTRSGPGICPVATVSPLRIGFVWHVDFAVRSSQVHVLKSFDAVTRLASFWRFSTTASSLPSASLATGHSLARHHHPPPSARLAGVRSCADPTFGHLLPLGEGTARRRMRGVSASASPTPHPAFG